MIHHYPSNSLTTALVNADVHSLMRHIMELLSHEAGIDAVAEPCHIPGNDEMNQNSPSHQRSCLIRPQIEHHDFTI
jgi:hypothetical protein